MGAGRPWLAAVSVLMAANGVMAISQTNIASIYLPVSSDLHLSLYGLGILTSVYFACYGIFEIPGGIVAARIGPKKIAILGGLLTSGAVIAGAVSPNFIALATTRALAGVGYGLLFPSVLVLMIRRLGTGSVGLGAALATISFSLGGFFGVLGWSVLSAWVGWRPSLLIEGIITLASILALLLAVPQDKLEPEFRVRLSDLKAAINRPMAALALSILGGGATAVLTATFLVYYLEVTFGMDPASAGLIGGATYFTPLVTAVYAGRLYDRRTNPKYLLLVGAVFVTLATAVVAFPSVYTAAMGSVVAGLATGVGGTVAFSLARDLATRKEYESLNVSIIDAASLVGLFVAPLYFSAIVLAWGYSAAWLIGSLTAVAFFVPVLFARFEKRGVPQAQ